MQQRPDGPPLVFSILGVVVGVLVAWLITKDEAMALTFLVAGTLLVVALRVIERRRRG